ncbi:MAG: sulfate transporter CysZ [Gammaproteobacteria bacterium]|nr:MAG: sulfate transporter CysZ [Gammaproteobacteria bacterium]
MIRDLLAGAHFFLSGFGLIRQRGLRRYALMPVLINILVFGVLLYAGVIGMESLLSGWLPGGDSWWAQLLRALAWLVFGAAAAALVFFGFTVAANLIGAPFNARLSERTEQLLRGSSANAGQVSPFREIGYASAHESRKLLYFAVRALPLWLLTLIPGVNLLAGPLWVLFTAWYMGMEYFDYPLSAHHRPFRELLAESRKYRALLSGFGLAAMAALMVPLMNLLVMPAAVAGATAMWVARYGQDDK